MKFDHCWSLQHVLMTCCLPWNSPQIHIFYFQACWAGSRLSADNTEPQCCTIYSVHYPQLHFHCQNFLLQFVSIFIFISVWVPCFHCGCTWSRRCWIAMRGQRTDSPHTPCDLWPVTMSRDMVWILKSGVLSSSIMETKHWDWSDEGWRYQVTAQYWIVLIFSCEDNKSRR